MGRKKRREFNKQWRRDRKRLKAARLAGDMDPAVLSLAAKYHIDYPKERIK